MGGLRSWQQLLEWNEVSDIEREHKKNSAPCMSIAPSLLYPALFCVVVICYLCSAALLVVG